MTVKFESEVNNFYLFQLIDKWTGTSNLNMFLTQSQENAALDRAARIHRNSACK